VKEKSSSFLKKRTKKLLFFRDKTQACRINHPSDANFKSFLLLFFKKEGLAFGILPGARLIPKNGFCALAHGGM
jgi:hypothetical protein